MVHSKPKNIAIRFSKIFSLLFSLLGLSITFVGGIFSSDTELEKVAEYASYIAQNNTNEQNLFGISVGSTNESGPLVDSSTEFYNLYGTFRQEKITFASVINENKQHDIYLKDVVSNSLSMLYVGPVGSIAYKGHYKHYQYPIELMFADEKNYDISKFVVYISRSQADELLGKNGVVKQDNGKYNDSDYKGLLKQTVMMTIDGTTSSFLIQNIFIEGNYYYSGLKSVAGDFVIVSYYVPNGLRNEKTNMYFMSNYVYQNKYFMEHIKSTYSNQKYKVSISGVNINGDINEDYLVSFYYSANKGYNWVFTSIICVSSFCLLLSLLLFFLDGTFNKQLKLLNIIYYPLLLLPYILFNIIYLLSGNVSVFSEASTKANAMMLIVFILATFVCALICKRINSRKMNKEAIYGELDI